MPSIKVLSLNTWMGGVVGQPLFDYVIAEKPDIVLLQEVYSGADLRFEPRFRSQQLLESLFPAYHSYFAALVGDERESEGLLDKGNLILSRWPLSETKMIFFDHPYATYDHDNSTDFSLWPSAAQRALATLDTGIKVQLVNIHGPVWMDGAEPTERRVNMVNVLNQLLSTKLPTVVAGDSNATPDNPCWVSLTAPYYSIFGKQLKTTFNMRRKNIPGYGSASVDLILVSPDIKVCSAHCPDVDVSDHLPLLAQLEL